MTIAMFFHAVLLRCNGVACLKAYRHAQQLRNLRRTPGASSIGSAGLSFVMAFKRIAPAPRLARPAKRRDCLPLLRLLPGIVKLLGMMLSPGNSRHFPDAISTDPTLRQPALYPLLRPNSRSGFSSLLGTPTPTTGAVEGGNVGQWDHTPTKIAGHVLLTYTPACDAPVGASVDASSHSGC